MVTQVSNLSRSGLSDWVIQRLSAVILGVYSVGLAVWVATQPNLDHATWVALFSQDWMRIASLLALLSAVGHAWIGMWTIGTDYLRAAHVGGMANVLRYVYQAGCVMMLFVVAVWGVQILWRL